MISSNTSSGCRFGSRRYCSTDDSSATEGPKGDEDSGSASGGLKKSADNTSPLSNTDDHMVSAVSGNGEVVARAITARSLVQVRRN